VNSLPAIGSGGLVGFTLGLIGGGGSIVATPLLLYAVGLPPHVAIGTGALAVSTNALVNFGGHARAGNVRWAVAALFAATGAAGALAGSTLGKAFDGGRLILMFAALMLVIGALMLRPRRDGEAAPVPMTKGVAAKIAAMGLGVGLVAGFFGIGGGFLIVPGLVLATGMPTINAIGTSLLAVAAFGLATALNYHARIMPPRKPAQRAQPGFRGPGLRGRPLHHVALGQPRMTPDQTKGQSHDHPHTS